MNNLTLSQLAKSRTAQTIAIGTAFEIAQQVSPFLPSEWAALVTAALGVLALYFRKSPNQTPEKLVP
jgi:hypothetical protein